jgi:hypothetical protein
MNDIKTNIIDLRYKAMELGFLNPLIYNIDYTRIIPDLANQSYDMIQFLVKNVYSTSVVMTLIYKCMTCEFDISIYKLAKILWNELKLINVDIVSHEIYDHCYYVCIRNEINAILFLLNNSHLSQIKWIDTLLYDICDEDSNPEIINLLLDYGATTTVIPRDDDKRRYIQPIINTRNARKNFVKTYITDIICKDVAGIVASYLPDTEYQRRPFNYR